MLPRYLVVESRSKKRIEGAKKRIVCAMLNDRYIHMTYDPRNHVLRSTKFTKCLKGYIL